MMKYLIKHIMKQYIPALLLGITLLVLVGCAAYHAPLKCWMIEGESLDLHVKISDDDTEKILSLLNEGEWTQEGDNPGGTYVFELRGGKKIYYSLSGRLYDEEKDLYLYLHEEDWVYINRILLSQYMPPVEMLGPRVYGDKMTLSEAIDKFQVKLEEADRGGSLIIDHIFGGDVELAKQTMDSELFRSVFESPYIEMERLFDEHEWRVSLTNEVFRVGSSGISMRIETETSHRLYKGEKVNSDKGEYYIVDDTQKYIDLGDGVFIFFEIDDDLENREQKNQKLLDYVFSIRNCVPDWQATPIN